ncbi:MAG: N-6 DNA methylase [Verrucomicrobia bacterium]|nr:N-6 DNA methylase [Verrucomicrobiota bacterium]
MSAAGYNERSWAIDLIGHLQAIAHGGHQSVRYVSGEQTIAVDGGSMFPDVLLFGDRDAARILQGWELKLPDTAIDDVEFFENAEEKARSLGLDSFVLWNVTYARLYVLGDDDAFFLHKEWDDLNDITSRADVRRNRARWEALGATILQDMNALLASGDLEGRQFIDAYRSGGLTTLVLQNTQLVADAIKEEANRRRDLRSQITLWWSRNQQDYDGSDPHIVLARANLINWMGKFLFAHVLRERDDRAATVTGINEGTGPVNALATFDQITQDCNFWTVFCDAMALRIVPPEAWRQLCEFNRLLSDLRLGAVDQAQLSTVLETSAADSDRKLRGQYTTPAPLAKLLVKLCLDNLNDRILDPCCGSGTIIRAALDMKLQTGIDPAAAAAQVCGNDLDKPAVQLATFSLTSPLLMRQPLRLFDRDAFTLEPELNVTYRDPSDGSEHTEKLGTFQAVASNLPFVAQAGRATYGNAIQAVNTRLAKTGETLPGRSDIAAYLPFALYDLLEPGGRMGIIITNAWLGTAWGEAFYERLADFFELRTVVTSGAGRWFSNSDVVTNILVLQKPAQGADPDHGTDFVVLKQPLDVLEDDAHAENVAALINMGTPQEDVLTVHRTERETIERLRPMGLAGSAQFVGVDWVLDLPLVPARNLLDIRRGERRGWNDLFYPAPEHGIEPEYIEPVLRSSTDIEGLVTSAGREAFSCSRTVAELTARGDTGALAWIRRFENVRNGTNQPLPDVLAATAPPGGHWYEMRADRLTELVVPMGYGSRLYVGRLDPPAFVDQRLIALNAKEETDIDLVHALLNSTLGLFMIEAIGFGRGLGVLDLNKDRIEKSLHVLDPSVLDKAQRERVVDAFQPLLHRDILEIADELEQDDRMTFDDIVLEAFAIQVGRELIYASLRTLTEIRQAVET